MQTWSSWGSQIFTGMMHSAQFWLVLGLLLLWGYGKRKRDKAALTPEERDARAPEPLAAKPARKQRQSWNGFIIFVTVCAVWSGYLYAQPLYFANFQAMPLIEGILYLLFAFFIWFSPYFLVGLIVVFGLRLVVSIFGEANRDSARKTNELLERNNVLLEALRAEAKQKKRARVGEQRVPVRTEEQSRFLAEERRKMHAFVDEERRKRGIDAGRGLGEP